jgi:hypothetical protein
MPLSQERTLVLSPKQSMAGQSYGGTKQGKFMTEAEAKAAGFREAAKD